MTSMDLFQAAVLGLVQGLTEFLPISSTAHLRIVPALLGWDDPGAAYSAVIQLGTVVAVIFYFWKDLGRLIVAFFRGIARRAPLEEVDSRLAWLVILGTLPIGIAGLAFKQDIETSLRSLYVISGSLIVLALLLFAAERMASHKRGIAELTVKDGLWVGAWQALALIPGASRSGTTITGGLFLGLKREDAARFSFLLAVPATGLAGLFELKNLLELEASARPSNAVLIVGIVVSFFSGMAAIAGLLAFLRKHSTMVFVVYRVGLGTLLLVLLWTGVLHPFDGAEVVPLLPPPPPPLGG
jgi:undecaprenyl-diphosphatase